jgi:hypothetical protein
MPKAAITNIIFGAKHCVCGRSVMNPGSVSAVAERHGAGFIRRHQLMEFEKSRLAQQIRVAIRNESAWRCRTVRRRGDHPTSVRRFHRHVFIMR